MLKKTLLCLTLCAFFTTASATDTETTTWYCNTAAEGTLRFCSDLSESIIDEPIMSPTLLELLTEGRLITIVATTEAETQALLAELHHLYNESHALGLVTVRIPSAESMEDNYLYSFPTGVTVTESILPPERMRTPSPIGLYTIYYSDDYLEWLSNEPCENKKHAKNLVDGLAEKVALSVETRKLKYNGTGISELKKRTEDNGLRIYYVIINGNLLILGAGNKDTQAKDIAQAQQELKAYFEETLKTLPKDSKSLKYYLLILDRYKQQFPSEKNQYKDFSKRFKEYVAYLESLAKEETRGKKSRR